METPKSPIVCPPCRYDCDHPCEAFLEEAQNLDVATVNAILKLLRDEMLSYPPDSKEAVALFKFKEKLSS